MPKRNPKNTSFGVLTSSTSTNFLSKDDIRKAFFSSSSDRNFYERKLTAEDRSESLLHIHNAGKTYGPYLPYKYNRAPLLDRDACFYTRAFTQKPMIGLQYDANKKVAEGFKPARARAGVTVNIGDWTSKYGSDFPPQTVEEMRNAKPPLWKGAKGGSLEAVVGGKGKMMVTKSHLQTTHSANFPKSMDVNGVASSTPPCNIELQGYHGGDFQRTSYCGEFGGQNQTRKQAVGTAFRMKIQRSSSEPGMTF